MPRRLPLRRSLADQFSSESEMVSALFSPESDLRYILYLSHFALPPAVGRFQLWKFRAKLLLHLIRHPAKDREADYSESEAMTRTKTGTYYECIFCKEIFQYPYYGYKYLSYEFPICDDCATSLFEEILDAHSLD